uniref:Unconventional prefoldin RPB5 interactor n=1 Tax=Cacopsylla melanoneura TaxID=428564 RepID=A0A8D8LH29_9HEMI
MENAFLGNTPNVMRNLLEQALEINESSVSTWMGYKTDLEDVKKNLINYSEKLTVPIMIPLCSKAMIPGKLVHTNQVLVGLGDNWFSKVSTKHAVENCDRRIQFCTDMIKKYEKEKNILDSRLKIPAADEGKEIIEPYNEEKMAKWREEHRESEKKYHKEKKKDEQQAQASVAEEELWRKLDELELQEELEDHLFLDGENEDDDDDLEEEDEEKDSGHSSDEDTPDIRISSNRTVINEAEPLQQQVPLSNASSSNEDNVIHITHSNIQPRPISYCSESPYQTPTCIYKEYLKIKQKTERNGKKVMFNVEEKSEQPPHQTVNTCSMVNSIQHDLVLKNITEDKTVDAQEGPKRPVSKFKMSRKS